MGSSTHSWTSCLLEHLVTPDAGVPSSRSWEQLTVNLRINHQTEQERENKTGMRRLRRETEINKERKN